ncbi:MAG: hypothetical protein UT68_C0001G0058 [Parcubacteria group bacterium GW2011_GWC2_40_10]|nr:MAG: hypothetical protein UT25_C0001G0057 [Parcubacteria group bacterium GW2011_GWC1_39_12]KKR19581.1 MAG: hypothetical protein UT49_C0001G0057 [Parcubacteria group bacterium GW2011_GWF1_39_37]KKR35735.1 MAG: hypothetical protein UT68_C0001G0058 [Parcubacteria group bacterium GW2011_GWC2_40_10]KKR52549.1 MAG: hypothetical protein UT89_C0001G0057 [Parcubacteria group bacterium GW2011_GWE1_40_20]KKS36075.1 MAG: hypothetical protein UU99_C0002G0057 [Parcubacteria group bacterium GW2011_GWE2_42_
MFQLIISDNLVWGIITNMKDTYRNFVELHEIEKEGEDFRIEARDIGSKVCVISIHGGNIEVGTTEIAKQIAGERFSFYSFSGLKKSEEESETLHITSSNFDEPQCCDLVFKSEKVLSIHGKGEMEDFVMVGGLDNESMNKVVDALNDSGFRTPQSPENVNGNSPMNICNRCYSKKGVQLEISRGLRNKLLSNESEMLKFCNSIRNCF